MPDSRMRRIVLVCHSLGCGGAERAMVLVAQGLSDRGYQVIVITIDNEQSDFYKLSPQVKRIALNVAEHSGNIWESISNNINRLLVLRKTIRSVQPDLVISFMDITNVTTLLSLINTRYKIVANEQNSQRSLESKPWRILRRLTYPFASKLVSVSHGVDTDFYWLPKAKKTVIYNPLTPKIIRPTTVEFPPGADVEKKWVVAVGRLVEQKNFSMLLSAFQRIAINHPDWQLLIFGEGKLRSQLQKQIDELGLQDRVLLPGITPNPFGIYQRAQLYVMSSLWEGLPAVLFEALSCGLPIISTDCPSGPREIIRDGIDGILVPNRDELALSQAMDMLMSDDGQRQAYSDRAKEAEDRFSLAKIVTEWEELIQQLLS